MKIRAAHRVLLWFYPRSLRDRLGPELSAFWSEQAMEPRYAGWWGWLRLAVQVFVDALIGGLRQRIRLAMGRGGRAAGPGGRGHGEEIASDVRHALKSIRGAPVHAMVVVTTLALGIGSTTAIFTVVDGVLLRPLPYPESAQLVTVARAAEDGPASVSWPDFRDWRDQAAGFSGMAAYAESDADFGWDEGAELLQGALVTRDMFDVLGATPVLGRTFTEQEDRLDGADAVILSWGLWQRRFGGAADVVGGVITIGGDRVPIVGVMPRGLRFPTIDTDYWRPLQDDELLRSAGLPTGSRTLSMLDVVGRLSGPIGPARTELSDLASRIDEAAGIEEDRRRGVVVESLQAALVGDVRLTLIMLLSAVSLVLLVACANVAGLALSRAASRSQELAVRAALGASRSRLVRQLLTESLVLAAAAGALGILIAWSLARLVIRVAPPDVPRIDEVGLDFSAVAFAALLAIASGVLFGIAPALRTTMGRLTDGLARRGRGTLSDRRTLRPQQLLVAFQVSLSVTLLAGAVLLVRSYSRLINIEPGYATEGVILASVPLPDDRYSEAEAIESFYSRLLDRVRALPGVLAATSTYSPPLMGNEFRTTLELEGEPENEDARLWVGSVVVRDGYFATTGTPLLRGRDFNSADRLGAPPVAIVNRVMAERYWPGEDAIGKRFRLTDGIRGSLGGYDRRFFPPDWFTVVGVAGNVRRESLEESPAPEYYRPHGQVPWSYQYLVVRADGDPAVLTRQLRQTLRALDPAVPFTEVRSVRSTVSDAVSEWRFRMLLLVSFGAITCLLAMLGVYAVMALAVVRRRKELGVRLALGATASELLVQVLRRGLILVGAGTLAGLAISVPGTRILESMLFEVAPTDPVTYMAVTAAIAAVALLACWLPARRASRIDPVRSLQQD